MICPLSPAHFVALGAFQISLALLFFDPRLAALPLALFVLLCLIMPFFTRLSFFLPIVSRGGKDAQGVALTFDDGPDPEVTPQLLQLLARHRVTATFFVTGRQAELHPEIVRQMLAQGHTVGNHSYSHLPWLMFQSRSVLRREIAAAQEVLLKLGVVPLAFRPPVGITNSRLWRALLENGMFCVNFSCRAADFGNRRIGALSRRILARVARGDIILLHDTRPRRGETAALLQEFEALIVGLQQKGLAIWPLDRVIGREVMRPAAAGSATNAAELFYNGLAATYDQEQFTSKVSLSRNTEHRLFTAQIPALFAGAGRVLEIGAGTGIFTLDIARNCREVLAADISGNMLALLEQKAQAQGIDNIRTLKGDVETLELDGPFSVVCAFSALEYLTDLPAFFRRIARQMEPGAALYFITARSSLFRLFTQVGNAMRQGLWLRAHTGREIESMLTAAGFERITHSSHLFKSFICGGMLLEVVARRSAGQGAAEESAPGGEGL